MNEAQEINKLRNTVGALTHDLDVARTENQLLRQLNQKLLEEKAVLEKISHEKVGHPLLATCPSCGTAVEGNP